LRQPTEYKSDLEIKQEAYEDGTPWYQYVYDRLKTGTLRIGAGMDATEILATAKVLDGFDDVKNGKLSKKDLHSDGHVASAKVSRLRRYLRAEPDERKEMEIEMGEKLASAVQGAWQSTAEADAIPSSPITRAALGAETIGEFWEYFEKDPMAVIGHYVLENGPKEAVAAAHAAVGSLMAGPAGAAVGRGLGGGSSAYGIALVDELKSHGAILNDPKSIRDALAKHGKDIRLGALKSGVIGAVESHVKATGLKKVIQIGHSTLKR